MTFHLKKGQTLADVFPATKWAQLFPASQSAVTGKRLDARKFVGVLNRDCNSMEIQKQMRDEWTKMLLDTNIIVSLFEGDSHLGIILQDIEPYLSFVSELEILSHKYVSREYQKYAEMFVADCHVINLNEGIKEMTRYVQWEYGLKLSDALVASTAMCLGIPLISGSHEFERVKELIFVFYQ